MCECECGCACRCVFEVHYECLNCGKLFKESYKEETRVISYTSYVSVYSKGIEKQVWVVCPNCKITDVKITDRRIIYQGKACHE